VLVHVPGTIIGKANEGAHRIDETGRKIKRD